MQLALEASDLAALSTSQKDAVLQALFIALIADGDPSAEELAQFEQEIAALPWGKDAAALRTVTRATVERLQKASDPEKAAFVKELGALIPPALREKVVFDMASIVAADRVATIVERQTIAAFIMAFGLDPQATIEKIKERIPASDVAAEQHVKLEPEDIEGLDDAQKLAVLEALVSAVLADGKPSQIELASFEHIVSNLPWGMEPAVVDAQIKGIAQRIAAFSAPAQISDFIVQMAARLPSQSLREKVFYTVATIIFADGAVSKVEQNTLGALVFAFGITSDRLAAIKLAVTGRSTPPPTRSNAS
jgi:uncharacterized tellurite resistance protein B-like protein